MAILKTILNVLSVILTGVHFINEFNAVGFVLSIMFIIGLAGIFRKSGVSPYWALVPCYRLFVLAKCADREAEGKALFFAELFYELDTLSGVFLNYDLFRVYTQ